MQRRLLKSNCYFILLNMNKYTIIIVLFFCGTAFGYNHKDFNLPVFEIQQSKTNVQHKQIKIMAWLLQQQNLIANKKTILDSEFANLLLEFNNLEDRGIFCAELTENVGKLFSEAVKKMATWEQLSESKDERVRLLRDCSSMLKEFALREEEQDEVDYQALAVIFQALGSMGRIAQYADDHSSIKEYTTDDDCGTLGIIFQAIADCIPSDPHPEIQQFATYAFNLVIEQKPALKNNYLNAPDNTSALSLAENIVKRVIQKFTDPKALREMFIFYKQLGNTLAVNPGERIKLSPRYNAATSLVHLIQLIQEGDEPTINSAFEAIRSFLVSDQVLFDNSIANLGSKEKKILLNKNKPFIQLGPILCGVDDHELMMELVKGVIYLTEKSGGNMALQQQAMQLLWFGVATAGYYKGTLGFCGYRSTEHANRVKHIVKALEKIQITDIICLQMAFEMLLDIARKNPGAASWVITKECMNKLMSNPLAEQALRELPYHNPEQKLVLFNDIVSNMQQGSDPFAGIDLAQENIPIAEQFIPVNNFNGVEERIKRLVHPPAIIVVGVQEPQPQVIIEVKQVVKTQQSGCFYKKCF